MAIQLLMRILVIAAVGMLLWLAGCSAASSNAHALAEQQNAFDAGMTAIKNRDYETAERKFSVAIADSSLSADLQEEAYLQRAHARMELAKFNEATADLDWLNERATNLDAVWIARGQLLRKQGDRAGASKAFDEARKINPKIAIPADRK